MKMFKKVLAFVVVLTMVSVFDSDVNAQAVPVASSTVVHQHTAEGGSCYKPVYHTHVGNTTSGGACYTLQSVTKQCTITKHYYTHVSSWLCEVCGNNSFTYEGVEDRHSSCGATSIYNAYKTTCTSCGAHGFDNTPNYSSTSHTYTASEYVLSCPKTAQTIDGYTLSCTKGSGVVASFEMYKNVTSDSYTLSISPILQSGVTVLSYKWSNGSTSSTCSVTSNSTYTCEVTISDGGIQRKSTLSYTVSDYDTQSPVVQTVSRVTNRVRSDVGVTVQAQDNVKVSDYMLNR